MRPTPRFLLLLTAGVAAGVLTHWWPASASGVSAPPAWTPPPGWTAVSTSLRELDAADLRALAGIIDIEVSRVARSGGSRPADTAPVREAVRLSQGKVSDAYFQAFAAQHVDQVGLLAALRRQTPLVQGLQSAITRDKTRLDALTHERQEAAGAVDKLVEAQRSSAADNDLIAAGQFDAMVTVSLAECDDLTILNHEAVSQELRRKAVERLRANPPAVRTTATTQTGGRISQELTASASVEVGLLAEAFDRILPAQPDQHRFWRLRVAPVYVQTRSSTGLARKSTESMPLPAGCSVTASVLRPAEGALPSPCGATDAPEWCSITEVSAMFPADAGSDLGRVAAAAGSKTILTAGEQARGSSKVYEEAAKALNDQIEAGRKDLQRIDDQLAALAKTLAESQLKQKQSCAEAQSWQQSLEESLDKASSTRQEMIRTRHASAPLNNSRSAVESALNRAVADAAVDRSVDREWLCTQGDERAYRCEHVQEPVLRPELLAWRIVEVTPEPGPSSDDARINVELAFYFRFAESPPALLAEPTGRPGFFKVEAPRPMEVEMVPGAQFAYHRAEEALAERNRGTNRVRPVRREDLAMVAGLCRRVETEKEPACICTWTDAPATDAQLLGKARYAIEPRGAFDDLGIADGVPRVIPMAETAACGVIFVEDRPVLPGCYE